MNLYYAMGGGLGHLTRARAFLHTFKIETESVILSASQFIDDKRIISELKFIRVNKNFEKDVPAFQSFLQKTFVELNIKTIYLDSFPLGITGEFVNFNLQNVEINYIARRLRWKNYLPLLNGRIPRFEKTFILEKLEIEHQKFINECSKKQSKIELNYPPLNLSDKDEDIFQYISKMEKPFWLIVHSGNENEILELVDFADEMREIEKAQVNLILISPNHLETVKQNLFQFNLYPASVLFNYAERIFTACGFNAMNQLKNFKNKHYFIPFERRYDDQFARAKQFQSKN